MTDKLAPYLPRITRFLLVALDRASADGERVNAMRAIDSALRHANVDKHDLIERIKTATAHRGGSAEIFDAGYNKRIADDAELRRRVVAVMARPQGGIEDGVNGYSWEEVAGYCALNKHKIRSEWEANFVESVAAQLASSRYRTPTEKQAPILRRIFVCWFNGKIT